MFSNYEKSTTNTYTFDKLPVTKDCGVNRLFDDKSTLLCKPGMNEPFVVWIVGWVLWTWFFDKESNPAVQVALNFVPVNDLTANAARHLLCVLLKPAICELFQRSIPMACN